MPTVVEPDELPKRIWIRGTSGSGKSRLACDAAKILQIPYVDLDDLWHLPGWQEREVEEFQELVSQVVAKDAWVLAGNYSKVVDIVMDRVDTVVWLDYSLPLVLRRVTWRTARRIVLRERCCNGNIEAFWRTFTRESIIVWAYTSYNKNRRKCDELLASKPAAVTFRRFQKPVEAKDWLAALAKSKTVCPDYRH